MKTQKAEIGTPLRENEVKLLKRAFSSRIDRAHISPEDCLKTLYSLELINNSRQAVPDKKSNVKPKLINKLTKDYMESNFFTFTDSEYSIRNQLNIDFPNPTSYNEQALEGKKGISDSSVRKVKKLFFDTYNSFLEKNCYFSKHPLSRNVTVKEAQKKVRYKAPIGTKQKLLLAGLAIAATPLLFSIIPPDTQVLDTSPYMEPVEITKNINVQTPEQIALQHIYSNPSLLNKLGLSNDICEEFNQYLRYKNNLKSGTEFDEFQKIEYDNMRKSLINSITISTLERSISNSFSSYPDSINAYATNGVSAKVSFNIGENNYSYDVQNANDINGYSNGSDLAQALSSRDIYESRNNVDFENYNTYDTLDDALASALKFSMKKIDVDKENGLITESSNPNLLQKLGIDNIEHNEER